MFVAVTEIKEPPDFTRDGVQVRDELVPLLTPISSGHMWIRRKFVDNWEFYKTFIEEN